MLFLSLWELFNVVKYLPYSNHVIPNTWVLFNIVKSPPYSSTDFTGILAHIVN